MKSEVLIKMGYPEWTIDKFSAFFLEIFENEDELENFFERVFKFDSEKKEPRRILNQIQQLISIADDIDVIRPARDPLRILFLRSCLEAIYKLADLSNKEAGKFFEEYMCDEGKKYIKENFRLILMKPVDQLEQDEWLSFEEKKSLLQFDLDNFAELFRSIRNDVVHDGNYYEMQIWARDEESTWLSHCESNECILGSLWKKNEFGMVTFHFETTMIYEKFRYFFLRGCVSFLDAYVSKIEQQ